MDLPQFSSSTDIPDSGIRLIAEKKSSPQTGIRFSLPKENELGDHEVLIELICAPINYADLLNMRGYYGTKPPKFPLSLGFEGIFKVLGSGKRVKSLKRGDHVMIARYDIGSWGSHLVVSERDVFKLPDAIDHITCSMLRVNIFTAYRMLHDFVKLDEDNFVVQNGSTSHVGQNVIQICKALGWKCLNIIRQAESSLTGDYLKKMGAEALVSVPDPKNWDIDQVYSDLGRYKWFSPLKIKLGLNCIGGEYSKCVEDLLSEKGYHVTYGGLADKHISPSIHSLIFKDITFKGYSMGRWLNLNCKDKSIDFMVNALLGIIHGGSYYRPPFVCYPLTQFKEAIDHFLCKKPSYPLPQRILFTRDVLFTQNAITLIKKM